MDCLQWLLFVHWLTRSMAAGSSWTRDQAQSPALAGGFFLPSPYLAPSSQGILSHWATREELSVYFVYGGLRLQMLPYFTKYSFSASVSCTWGKKDEHAFTTVKLISNKFWVFFLLTC